MKLLKKLCCAMALWTLFIGMANCSNDERTPEFETLTPTDSTTSYLRRLAE